MRALILTAVLLGLVGTAQAQTMTSRDPRGSITGRVEQRGNTTVYRNNRDRHAIYGNNHGNRTGQAGRRGKHAIYGNNRASATGQAQRR